MTFHGRNLFRCVAILAAFSSWAGCSSGNVVLGRAPATASPSASTAPTTAATASPTAGATTAPTASPTASAPATTAPTSSPSPSPSPTSSPTSVAASIYVLDVDKVLGFPANPVGTLNEAPVAEIVGGQAGLNGNFAIAFDASGNIYVTNAQNNSVTVFAANPMGMDYATPIATIVGSNTGLNYPDGIALDPSGKIYVANGSGSGPSITVYPANPSGTLNETPLATIAGNSTTLEQPTGLALDAAGRIYTADPVANNGITIFPASPVGTLNEAPFATISGKGTGLDYPLGVALDASGKIYVPSELNNTIAVFAANASGNAAPIATISGSTTGLNNPVGLGLDSSGKIYVSNQAGSSSSVTVYAANPSGALNEAPIATISGSNTQFSAPSGIAVR